MDMIESNALSLGARVRRAPHIRWRREVDTVVLYDTKTREMNSLNHAGALVWELLDGTMTLEEIAQAVVEEFKADKTRVQPDVLKFVEKLQQLSYVESVG